MRPPGAVVPLPHRRLLPVAVLGELGTLILAAVLFALAFPNFFSIWGWTPLGFICLAPMFAVINRASWAKIVPYGALFGFGSYALHNYWLATFHPLALIIVPVIYTGYFLVLFPLLKLARVASPRFGFILQAIIWVGYEYLKTQGFIGYSYGILGYSQYLITPLIRLSSLTGVWGVSLLVVFPSVALGSLLSSGEWPGVNLRNLLQHARPLAAPAGVYAAVLLAALAYGVASRVSLEGVPTWRVALVQQNVDPWRGGNRAYDESLQALIRQSNRALVDEPEIVIWSETSFVPGIYWHTHYRTDARRYDLVRELTAYLADQTVPFVVGNDDGRLERSASGEEERVDYNASLLFEGDRIVAVYRKLRLVPFTESFPFKGLGGVKRWLEAADTHFWKPGKQLVVFEAAGVRFSTPICFEDTFGYLGRQFVQAGADVLVNMTNDSWSGSVAAEMQHMAIAVFRATENRRSMVRSGNGGITTVIDPNGHIGTILAPFTEDYLLAEVPVYTASTTLYTRWGDWFGVVMVVGAALWLAIKLLVRRR